jgi:hypothetical protein
MIIHAGVTKDTGLFNSVVTTAATCTTSSRHKEQVFYSVSGYQGIAKCLTRASRAAEISVTMRPANGERYPIHQMKGCRIWTKTSKSRPVPWVSIRFA